MADNTIEKQSKDATGAAELLLNYDFEDLITGFGDGLANSSKRLGDNYIESVNKILYTESSLAKAAKALSEVDVGGSLPGLDFLGGEAAELGIKLFSAGLGALSQDMEIAYINVEVEKPVVDPEGMITKTKLELKMPRFLVYDQRPLSIKDAKLFFRMNLDTVYKKHTVEKDNKKESPALKFRGSVKGSSKEHTDSSKDTNVIGKSEIAVTINYAQSSKQPVAHQILEEVFKDISTPIEK